MAQSDFYGYLFQSDKKPTIVLDALLRGIAKYIQDSVGNTEEKYLTPAKLASFYKAVGGNYDSLFVDVPYSSISWIYASIGCQHSLRPKGTPDDDFKPPTVPTLTTSGFVRWQSIEILLGPEEHVPFIQTAVKNFAIKNPDTGDIFPIDLPTSSFPLVPDKAIEKWHNRCAEKLKERATPYDTPNEDEDERPDLPPRPRVRTGFSHVRAEAPRYYFQEPKSRSRPIPYSHVSVAGPGRPVRPKLSKNPTHQARQFPATEAPSSPYNRGRRRSFPDNTSSLSSPLSPRNVPPPQEPVPRSRRHSHPRRARRGSVSSDASSSAGGEGEDEDSPPSPKHTKPEDYISEAAAVAGTTGVTAAAAKRKSHPPREEPPIIRFAPALSPTAGTPTAATPPEVRLRRRISRDRAASVLSEEEEEAKRHSYTIPIDRTGKLSAPFLLGNRERPRRNDSRSGVTWKDVTSVPAEGWRGESKSSEEDRMSPQVSRKSSRHESEREGESGGGGSGGSRPRRRRGDTEGEDRPMLRERRYSSHEDVTRRRRDRDHDRERDREMAGGQWRDRERRAGSPVRGVDGRKYPTIR